MALRSATAWAAMIVLSAQAFAGGAAAQGSDCDAASRSCGAQIEPRCLEQLGAGAAAQAAGECLGQLSAYRDCLSAVAQQCPAPSAATPQARAEMMAVWAEVKTSQNPDVLEAFARDYPGTSMAALALDRARTLRGGGEADPAPAAAAPPPRVAGVPMKPQPPADKTQPTNFQAAVRQLQAAVERDRACNAQVRATGAALRTGHLLLEGPEDPLRAEKTALTQRLDPTLLDDLLARRNDAGGCVVRVLESISPINYNILALAAEAAEREERLLAALIAGEMTFGAANARALDEAKALETQMAAVMISLIGGGAFSPGSAADKATATAALARWTEAQQAVNRLAPAARVRSCAWNGPALDCL